MSVTSAAAPVCPHCGYAVNDHTATICARCARPLNAAPQEITSSFGPASASPYPPPPVPRQPPAPSAASVSQADEQRSPLFASTLRGTVTKVEQAIGQPPADPTRLLTACAIAAGVAPLLTLAHPPLVIVVGAAMILIVALGLWQMLAARRTQNMLMLSMDMPTRAGAHVLLVEPSGQPAVGDEVEAQGAFLAGGRFYAHRLRVLAAAASDAPQNALARGRLTYTGRGRGALWTPLVVLLFWVFFWVAFSILLHIILAHGPSLLPH